MLICPKCKSEYQEGYHTCNDCKCELIEVLDPVTKEDDNKPWISILQFVAGMALILCAPYISYRLTESYFAPGGNGIYNGEHFTWMLQAYHWSILIVGVLICVPCVLYWYKKYIK